MHVSLTLKSGEEVHFSHVENCFVSDFWVEIVSFSGTKYYNSAEVRYVGLVDGE